jgi:hypothetical protein
MTLDEDRAERVHRKAADLCDKLKHASGRSQNMSESLMIGLLAIEVVDLEDEIRALKDEVRLAASGGRER